MTVDACLCADAYSDGPDGADNRLFLEGTGRDLPVGAEFGANRADGIRMADPKGFRNSD